VIEVETDCEWTAGSIEPNIRTIALYRTARLIMEGSASIPTNATL